MAVSAVWSIGRIRRSIVTCAKAFTPSIGQAPATRISKPANAHKNVGRISESAIPHIHISGSHPAGPHASMGEPFIAMSATPTQTGNIRGGQSLMSQASGIDSSPTIPMSRSGQRKKPPLRGGFKMVQVFRSCGGWRVTYPPYPRSYARQVDGKNLAGTEPAA